MDFDWDPAKARANRLKHGVEFAEAAVAVEDPQARHQPDPDADGKDRYVALGLDGLGRVLVVINTYRDETVRIISARRASKRERAQYEEIL